MIKYKIKKNSGFVALISAIIISAVLLLMVANLNLTGFYSRSDILDSELKEKSSALAEACVDTALLKLANDANYAGEETVTVSGSDTCIIESMLGNPKVISVRANYKNYFTNLKIVVDSDAFIVSWEEI